MKTDAPGIKVLCPTRWTVRTESFNRIIENYDALVKLWDECLDTKLDTEMRTRIIGVKAQMLDFNYFFGVNLGERLFSMTDNLSRTLLQTRMSVVQGQRLAELTKQTIQKMRTDDDFDDSSVW